MSEQPTTTTAHTGPTRDAALNRVDHMVIGVNDVASAAAWYRDILGLTVLDTSHSRAVLSCDGTQSDLILAAGGPGLRSFAIGAADRTALERFAGMADAADLSVESVETPDRPGIDGLVRVALPGNQSLEIVTRSTGSAGTVTDKWSDGRVTPLGIDHVGLASSDPAQLTELLARSLPFDISEKVMISGDVCLAAFIRTSTYHHDVSVIATPDASHTMHHYAFAVGGMEQFKIIADRFAERSLPVEHGPLRHGNPSYNLAMYARDPDGNRIEFTAEMKTIPWGTNTHITDEAAAPLAVNMWRPGQAPDDFFTTAT